MTATAQLPIARLTLLGARFRALAADTSLIPETVAREPRVLRSEKRVSEIQAQITEDRSMMHRGVLRLSLLSRFFLRLNYPLSQSVNRVPAPLVTARHTAGRSK